MRLHVDDERATVRISELRLRPATVDVAEIKLDWCTVDGGITVDDSTELSWQLQKRRVVFAAFGVIAKVGLPGSSYIVPHAGCSLSRWKYVQKGCVTFQDFAVVVWKRRFAPGETSKSEGQILSSTFYTHGQTNFAHANRSPTCKRISLHVKMRICRPIELRVVETEEA